MKNVRLITSFIGVTFAGLFTVTSIGNAESATYTQTGGTVHYNWGYGAPSGVQNDHFTAQFNQSQNMNAGDYFVHTLADDRVRVTFDGKKVIDRWYDVGGQIDRALITNVKQGDHKIQTDFYENGGQAAIFSDIVPFDHWLAYYYPNRNLEGYPVDAKIIAPQGIEKALVENSGEGSPSPKIPADNFSARYTTVKRLPAGEYIVRGKADDGMRLFIDGKLIIDEWDTGKWDKEHARKITIQDNTASGAFGSTNEKDTHLVEVQYMEAVRSSDVKFSIQPYKDVVQHDTWTAEYYNNTEFKGDAVVVAGKNSKDRIDTINFDWKDGSPHPNVKSDNFTARFTKVQDFKSGDYYFGGIVDDGMRVYLDDKLIIDNWGGGYDKISAKKVPVTEGKHKVTVEYLELTGGANLKFDIEPYSQAIQQNTWTAEYFNNTEFKGNPVHIAGKTNKDKIDKIQFDWKNGSPHPSVPADNFSIRYTKIANFDEGEYYFDGVTDDGVRVYLDDKLVIDNWGGGDNKLYGLNRAVTGGKHKITVEYLELTGGAKFTFNYSKNEDKMCKRLNRTGLRSLQSTVKKNPMEELNVKSESTTNTVSLKWNGIADKYKVYLKNKLVYTGTEASYTHKNLSDNTRYSFKVVAFDKDNKPVDVNIVQIMTKENAKMALARSAAPTKTTVLDNVTLAANITKDTIEQKWDGKIPDDDGTYEVYRNDDKLGETQSSCFIDTAVTPGEHYYYKVLGKTKITDSKMLQEAKDKGVKEDSDGNYYLYYEIGNEAKIPKIEEEYFYASPKRGVASSGYDYQYEFKYKTFIPKDKVSMVGFGEGAEFHGDDRKFSYSDNRYRTQTVVLARFTNGTSSAKLTDETDVAESILYKPGHSPEYARASKDGISLETIYSTRNSLVFTVNHSVGIPFKAFYYISPPTIDYWYVASLSMEGDNSVTGRHDRAPSHELYLTRPYTDRPRVTLVRDRHEGFHNLFGIGKSFKYYWEGTS
ncbi:PA14 domain-containing protein [Bacillus sp. 123MFChir2]|uniref:PA14 domain-containing protein n=1 Tax=Bacillus sp. 123MFChir2 TaxID=1169144 RepID=UPI00035D1652|nr:PA14 domain-containing protein [Bacillus sp. 123MFChir2]